MVGLEERYLAGDWIPPFLSISVDSSDVPAIGESTKAMCDEPATATEAPPLANLANKESTTNVSTSVSPTTEPAAKKRCKGKIVC